MKFVALCSSVARVMAIARSWVRQHGRIIQRESMVRESGKPENTGRWEAKREGMGSLEGGRLTRRQGCGEVEV